MSCCQSLTDLVSLALHTVKVAFRTGLCVAEVRDRIEPPGGSSLSWSTLIPGLSGEVAALVISEFGNSKVRVIPPFSNRALADHHSGSSCMFKTLHQRICRHGSDSQWATERPRRAQTVRTPSKKLTQAFNSGTVSCSPSLSGIRYPRDSRLNITDRFHTLPTRDSNNLKSRLSK